MLILNLTNSRSQVLPVVLWV